jgi:NAD(P)H-hydrate repair Nnr-like enzyme with NAD(P)H-hydrate epimerase domain
MIAFPKDVVVDGLVGIGQIHNGTAPGRSLVPGGMPASAARLT